MENKQLKPLTLKYAIKNHFSPIDCIKYFKPEWSNEQCDIYCTGIIIRLPDNFKPSI